jgi:crotonobetainyl-CoA:carnitine CoA-transferase CaiB-like acyl-CoA transferase
MSVTGEADGMPTKVGVAIADVMTGMQSAIAILAALRHRDATGSGQHIDAALLDTQVSWLVNQATNFLISGKAPGRLGNAHPNVAPYQVFETLDGHLILAIGNDGQFVKFCNHVGQAELAQDEQFATNAARITNRELLAGIVTGILTTKSTNTWISELEGAGVPCGPVNDIAGVFDDPQVQARDMQISMEHPLSVDPIDLVAYPLKLSDTPAQYRRPPPILGQHTEEVLTELAGMSADEVTRLKESAIL